MRENKNEKNSEMGQQSTIRWFWIADYKIQKSFHTLEIRWCECSNTWMDMKATGSWNGMVFVCISFILLKCAHLSSEQLQDIWYGWNEAFICWLMRFVTFFFIRAYCHIEILDKTVKCHIQTRKRTLSHTHRQNSIYAHTHPHAFIHQLQIFWSCWFSFWYVCCGYGECESLGVY